MVLEGSLQKPIKELFAGQNPFHVIAFVSCAMVFHERVRRLHVRAYVAAKAFLVPDPIREGSLLPRLVLRAALHQPLSQHIQCLVVVVVVVMVVVIVLV